MNYLRITQTLDVLRRYYPNYYRSEWTLLAEDTLKWIEGELQEGNSTLCYLRELFTSQEEAITAVWQRLESLRKAFEELN
ncbi:MAG TPA: hypothetical protein PLX35_07430 [Cyclobacteriaceae bacterium]|nr:hypothetical protein [Cyclobacteriaceae bacterium]